MGKSEHAAQAPSLRVTKIQNPACLGAWVLTFGIFLEFES
jgi:hypothetical protein